MSRSLTPSQLLNFYKLAEKLKTTMRHSWLSDSSRQESVAEHSWMMALMAMVTLPHIKQKLDTQKVLKMIIVHDLAEAVTKDLPVWEGVQNKEQKQQTELDAIKKMFATLDTQTADELFKIWQEYEERESPEAKFVKVIDTLDVIVQHDVADLSTWDDNDYFWQLSPMQNDFFDFDEFLRSVKDEIDIWSIEKVKKVGKLDKLDQKELARRK